MTLLLGLALIPCVITFVVVRRSMGRDFWPWTISCAIAAFFNILGGIAMGYGIDYADNDETGPWWVEATLIWMGIGAAAFLVFLGLVLRSALIRRGPRTG